MSNASIRPPTRREEYAEATRKAIVEAARKLFCTNGFFGTKVEDIAAEARVSPATIYAVAGGKQGLLQTLMDMGTAAPNVTATHEAIAATQDPLEVINRTAEGIRQVRERFGDIARVIIQTAPHDESAAETYAVAARRYRDALAVAAQRLADLGALRDGLGAREATDILWFYFGFAGLDTLINDNGWDHDRAETWLAEQARKALLKPSQACLKRADPAARQSAQ
jgi:AcrR family transcriptional regulator